MELDLESAVREIPKNITDEELDTIDVKLGKVTDWDSMICTSCQ